MGWLHIPWMYLETPSFLQEAHKHKQLRNEAPKHFRVFQNIRCSGTATVPAGYEDPWKSLGADPA